MDLMSTMLAVIFVFSLRGIEADKCSNTAYSLRNMKLQHNIIKTESGVHDIPTCLDKCSTHGSCHSINLNEMKGACELNSANHLSKPEHMTYFHGMVYVNYFLRPVSQCSKAYCRKDDQECAMDKDGRNYKCVKQCQDIVTFPGKNTSDRIYLENAFASLQNFTLEAWIQLDPKDVDSVSRPTFFSLATSRNDNELVLYTTKGTGYGVDIGDKKTQIQDANVGNSQWHHICLTWEFKTGQYHLFIDGVIKTHGNKNLGRPIGKGMIIIGNDQDSYNGGFQLSDSYQGNITSINIWNSTFTPQQVSVLAKSCSKREGNVVGWSQLKVNRVGNVGLSCSTACV